MRRAAVTLLLTLLSFSGTAFAGPTRHLTVSGARFVTSDGKTFQWRGISAFRLVELVAHGKKDEAAAYLDWAAGRRLTVVRVLTMARHLFTLEPAEGVRALPELLQMAAARGLHVEIVALADTTDMAVDVDAHVKAVGAVAALHPNALVEIANEPVHPTQLARLHDPAAVTRLRDVIPAGVPVALGSAEENGAFAAGDYATMHFPRVTGKGGWEYMVALADGAELVTTWRKPVVSDEPIGAAAELAAGRRDNDPAMFRVTAVLTRLAGLGATFHYEGGLQARIPDGRELECYDAWADGWTLLPDDIESMGVFRRGGDLVAAELPGAIPEETLMFERQDADAAWVLVLGPDANAVRWKAGWRTSGQPRELGGATLFTATRSK